MEADKKGHETEENLSKGREVEMVSQPDTEKKVRLNMSSNGNTFGRRRSTAEKRKTISVVERS